MLRNFRPNSPDRPSVREVDTPAKKEDVAGAEDNGHELPCGLPVHHEHLLGSCTWHEAVGPHQA